MSPRLFEIHQGDQCFRWTDGNGVDTWIPVEPVTELCWRGELDAVLMPLQFGDGLEAYRRHLVEANDVDTAKAMAMPAEALRVPPLLMLLEDETSIPLDGSHRLWRMLGELIEGKRRHVIGWLVTHRSMKAAGLLFDRPPVPIVHHDGYDEAEHHRRALTSFDRYRLELGE